VARDRIWFFATSRYAESSQYAVGNYYNKAAGTLFYEPDLTRPAYELNYYQEVGIKMTMQAAAAHKVTLLGRVERSCACFSDALQGRKSPEATGDRRYPWGNYTLQGSWTNPLTSRILLESGFNLLGSRIVSRFSNDGTADDGTSGDLPVFDRVRNFCTARPARIWGRAMPGDIRIIRRSICGVRSPTSRGRTTSKRGSSSAADGSTTGRSSTTT
jgi:hypothetical protein